MNEILGVVAMLDNTQGDPHGNGGPGGPIYLDVVRDTLHPPPCTLPDRLRPLATGVFEHRGRTVLTLDLERLKSELARPVVVDLRNIYRPEDMAALGFVYESVGRGAV